MSAGKGKRVHVYVYVWRPFVRVALSRIQLRAGGYLFGAGCLEGVSISIRKPRRRCRHQLEFRAGALEWLFGGQVAAPVTRRQISVSEASGSSKGGISR